MFRSVSLLIALALTLAATAAAPAQDPSSSLAGAWEGEARSRTWPIFLTLRLRPDGPRLGGDLLLFGRTVALEPFTPDGASFSAAGGESRSRYVVAGRRDGDRLVGTVRIGDSDLPFALRPIPALPTPANRLEAWRQDVDALAHRFGVAERSFPPARRAAFVAAVAGLRRDLPRLSDPQIIVRMASAIALGGNAHSRLYLLRNRTELRRMPIRLWWFSDGLYVVRATRDHRDLLGCRVAGIERTDARRARDRVAPAFAGREGWIDYMSVYSLTSPEMLAGFGIASNMEAIRYRLADCPRAGTVTLAPLPLVRSTSAVEAWWDLAPDAPATGPGEWAQLLDGAAARPLHLRSPRLSYWFEHLAESGILYVQYNRSANMESETVAQFGERLLQALGAHPVRALVIDLRFNTGGDLGIAAPLMSALQQRSRDIPRFVITSRSTFSAGISHAADWRQSGPVTIVGEPVGDVLDYWSEGGNIILPNSGLAAHFANGAHSYSPAPCPTADFCMDMSVTSVDPDLPVTASFADYRSGRDVAMEAILGALSAQR